MAASPSVTATPLPPPATPLPPGLAAEVLLLNGKIITVDPADAIAQAIAVKDRRIQAVGIDADIAPLAGERTQVIDMGGRAVTPGLFDAHNHFQIMGLLDGYYVPFLPPEVGTIADLQARPAEAAAQTPEGEWIQGYFTVVAEGRLANRHDLDPISPNNRTHHPPQPPAYVG